MKYLYNNNIKQQEMSKRVKVFASKSRELLPTSFGIPKSIGLLFAENKFWHAVGIYGIFVEIEEYCIYVM